MNINVVEVLHGDIDKVYRDLNELTINNSDARVDVIFYDGKVINTTVKHLIVNMFVFEILVEWNIKFNDFYIKEDAVLKTSVYEQIFLDIYFDILEYHQDYQVYDKFSEGLWITINRLMNFIQLHCNAYVQTIDLISIIELRKDKKFIKYVGLDTWDPNSLTVKQAEKQENIIQKKMIEYLKTHDNPFRPYVEMGVINETQLYTLLISVGFKTDIDEKVIPHYIKSSYLEGLDSNLEYVLDSLATKKSKFYNRSGITDTRYFERTMQLLGVNIRNVYPGDCGTKITIPTLITSTTHKNFYGKRIDMDGKCITLNKYNIDKYVGKIVNLYNAITCKYTDGVCEKCGGLITFFFPRRFNIGLLSVINVIEPASQRVLSAKHFQKVFIIKWKEDIASNFFKYFKVKNGSIYPTYEGTKHKLLIDINVVKNIINLPYFNSGHINNDNATTINKITMFDNAGRHKDGPILLKSKGVSPTLSHEFIKYFIKDKKLIQFLDEKYALIDLSRFPTNKPIMKIEILSDSMIGFVKSIIDLFKYNIKNYTDAEELLTQVSNIIFSKLNVNITYVEIILKACLITSKDDYRVPVVEDYKNTMFDTVVNINTKRSIGTMMGYERHFSVMCDPDFILQEKQPSDFDVLLNIQSE